MKTKPKNKTCLFFLSIILCLSSSSLKTFAQHDDLLEETWYLYKVEIDGEDYFYSDLDIESEDEARIEIVVENNLEGVILPYGCPGSGCVYYIEFIENENKFVIISESECLAMEFCTYYRYNGNNDEYIEIKNFYDSFYFDNNEMIINYDWETIDEISFLVFTDSQNNKLYFSAGNLSILNFEILNSSIYPNPVQEQLFIHLEDISAAVNIEIYDLQGRLIKNFETTQKETSLNVSNYQAGMYFVKLTNSSNQQKMMKFIKR